MRPVIILAALLAPAIGCASANTTSSPSEPDAGRSTRDPCERVATPGLREVVFGTASADAACAEQRRQEAERERERHAELAARNVAEVRARYQAERELELREQHKADEEAAVALARANQIHERTRYEGALVAAGETGECELTWEEANAAYAVLREYAADPRRDKAIARLERCRKEYAARVHKVGPSLYVEHRRDVAILIEDAFDEANPYRKGLLVAKVDGTQLVVRLKGTFEGRARHSQNEVETWCEMDATRIFSKVTLKNSHGTFSCRPLAWPGSTKAILNEILVESGADQPLATTPGSRPIPTSPDVGPDPFR